MDPSEAAGPVGLTSAEAARRLVADGPNELPAARRRSLRSEIWAVVRQPMLLLLVVGATIHLLLADPLDGAVLGLFVVLVVAITVVQEHKTEAALTALRDLASPRALVVRDGRRIRIAGREVVRGDVVLLAEGDRVPADVVVVAGEGLAADESSLTGESVPVEKVPGDDATARCFSGSLVVRGHGVARVTATGADTELGRIGRSVRDVATTRTRLQAEVDHLVRVVAVIGLVVAAVATVAFGVLRGRWPAACIAGITTAMAILPEEFPVVLTVFLALGAWRMARHGVLTRRPAVVETLGSATVVCVDKTGTLTTNVMTVRDLVTGTGACAVGDGPLPEVVHGLAEAAVLAAPVDPFDPMDRAFRDLGDRYLRGTEHEHADWVLEREYPLSPELLALAHVWRSADRHRFVVAAKGAPEAVMDLCHLGPEAVATWDAQVRRLTSAGRRVLAVARARFPAAEPLPTALHDFAFELVGLVGLQDPLRPGVVDAVAACRKAGVRTVMITGDHPETARTIAEAIGLDPQDGLITGPELDALPDAALAERIRSVTVFARAAPEQKLRVVRALQADGEVVAMTGDGVNDAPALRAADIGIAMGGHGTDVAREAADLVLTDDDLSSIVDGVRGGRGILDNLRKAMAFVVAVHVPIVGMSIVPLLTDHWPLALLPAQIALFQLVIDPACSVVFEAESPDPRLMERPPRRGGAVLDRPVLFGCAVQGAVALGAVLAVYFWAVATHRPGPEVRSVTFVTLVATDLGLILVNRSWRLGLVRSVRERHNPTLRWILLGTPLVGTALLVVPPVRRALGFGALGLLDATAAAVAALVAVWVIELLRAWWADGGRRPSDRHPPGCAS